jgi:hypothetical protein
VFVLADSPLKRAVILVQQNGRQTNGCTALAVPTAVEAGGIQLHGLELAGWLERLGLAGEVADLAISKRELTDRQNFQMA